MKKFAKNVIMAVLSIALLCSVMCACSQSTQSNVDSGVESSIEPISNTIKIPDIEKLDITTAKTLLAGKGLIPKVEYEYHNNYDYDMVIRTEPTIGSDVDEDTPVTLYVCKGPSYYELSDSVGRMWNIEGIQDFIWWSEAEDGWGTKGFTDVFVQEGYLHIKMYLRCTSKYDLEFYGDFGTASINDTFDKTVPIKVIYDSKKVDNEGGQTNFEVKIPLSDLGVQKPTNINIRFDFLVNNERETFQAGFDLSW